ncbi:MAG: RNA methyltransferase [Candidatus Micrarchaeia archaeon]
MKISVMLVEPLYPINIGYIARTMKNFGVKNLYVMKPRCKYKGSKAIMYSKHAHEILEEAKVVSSIEEARVLSKASIVVGTTGIWHKTEASFYNVFTPEDFIKKSRNQKSMLLILGRDDTGLTKEELAECDSTIFVPASKEYPVLNISHALAIILYVIKKEDTSKPYKFEALAASQSTRRSLFMLFRKIVNSNPKIRNKKAVIATFEHIINRSEPKEKELKALAIAFSE